MAVPCKYISIFFNQLTFLINILQLSIGFNRVLYLKTNSLNMLILIGFERYSVELATGNRVRFNRLREFESLSLRQF